MQAYFQEHIEKYSGIALKAFLKVIRSFVLFNAIALLILGCEVFGFFYLLNTHPKSLLLAVNIALICLSLFTYFVLTTYFQAKKPEELRKIKEWFVSSLQKDLLAEKGSSEYHLLLANSSYQFSSFLQKNEYHCYKLKWSLPTINLLLKKFSNVCHWRDIHRMKEMLLLESIEEHVKLIKKEPTDLEAHASLANAYMALSRLYRFSEGMSHKEEIKWKAKFLLSDESVKRFQAAARRAIEELKILDNYSPNDPWVHAQLASCYHDLADYESEIKEYETILDLYPEDREILFRLGQLYFKQGINAKGLRIYEKLKKIDEKGAAAMIEEYDIFISHCFAATDLL